VLLVAGLRTTRGSALFADAQPATRDGLTPARLRAAGRLPNGLPFGLQVTGPRFRDRLLLDLAGAWEQARPWPRAADGYEPFDAGLT
jgi:Asp-tRNA(Asn)/Glu-tRNA(Gln) amidotransferase A subunit family amidase